MRVLKWIGIVLGVLFFIAVAFLARLHGKMMGPDVPTCRLPELDRKSFGKPQQLSGLDSPGARVYDIEPHGALLEDGSLAVVYNPRDGILKGTSGLSTALIAADGTAEIHAYPVDRTQAFDAWMARGKDGKLRMVYLAHDGGRPEVHMKVAYAESTDGKSWSAPPSEAHAPPDCPEGQEGCLDKPMIATTSSSVLVFYYSTVEPEGLRVTRAPLAGARFEKSARIGNGAYADVEVSPSGRVHVVFVGNLDESAETEPFGDPKNDVLYTMSADDGASFSAPIEVSAPEEPIPFFFSNPQVVADEARGLLYVAYPSGRRDGRWALRLATSPDGGKSWTRITVNHDEPCATHMTPHAALDPRTGVLHLTWLENRSQQGTLAYAACAPGGASCGKNEAVSDLFPAFSFARHLPMWLGEYGLLALDAEHRRLHAVWTQPVDEDGDTISRIFHAEARLPD